MQPARPQLSSRPCPACGMDVDPLRAARVLYLEDGVRCFCSDRCKTRFLRGERDFDTPARQPTERPRVERPSIPDLVREATFVRDQSDAGNGERDQRRTYDPLIAIALAALAFTLLLLTEGAGPAWLAAFLVVISAAINARIPLPTVQAAPSLQVVAPVGLVLAVVSGAMSADPQAQRWSLLGAAVAAVAVSIRSGLHASLVASLRAAARALHETLPLKARVPSGGASAYEEVSAASLRQGELVVLLEGEHAPADGVIEEGSPRLLTRGGTTRATSFWRAPACWRAPSPSASTGPAANAASFARSSSANGSTRTAP
jgi:YHS domain-containing protein